MKRKPLSHFLVALLVFAQLFSLFPTALAAGERDLLALDPPLIEITAGSFTASVGGVEVSDYDNIPQNAHIKIDYAFSVLEADDPANDVKAGDYFTIALPAALTDIASFTPVTDRPLTLEWEGVTYTIGHLSITAAGVATITFAADIESLSDVSSNFSIEGDLIEANIGSGPPVSFSLFADGVIYTIGFEDDPLPPEPPEATIEKSGVYDPATNRITWTVRVDAGDPAVTLEDVRVVDSLGADQTYVSSSVPAANVSVNADGDYVFSLGDVTGSTSFTVVTAPADSAFGAEGSTKNVANNVSLYVEAFADPISTDDASVPVTTDWISKSGVARTGPGGVVYIDWTITLNNNNRTIPADAAVTDTLPSEYLAFVPGSVLRNDAAPPADDTVSISGQTLTYTFGDAATGVQTIKFTTQVLDEYYTQQAQTGFANTAALNIVPNSYAATSDGVSVGTSLIAKSGAGYDPATQLITWRIAVNGNGRAITDAYVTDTLGSNQSFYADFVPTLQNGGGPAVALTLAASAEEARTGTNTYYYASSTGLVIGLGDLAASDRPVITFKTRVTYAAHYAANSTRTYYNASATLVGNGVETSVASNAPQTVASTVLAKANTGYNYETKTLSWRITVNQNNMPMPNAEVIDTIPAGQTYVAGSLLIDGAAPGDKLSVSGNALTVRLGAITAQSVITFDTVVADQSVFLTTNGNVTFTNGAQLTSGIVGAPAVNVSAQFTVPNKPVDKTVYQDYSRERGYIGWEVTVNPNQAPMSGASLSDRLQPGLELDNESVHLYYWNQSATGVMSIGDEVDPALYSFSYDYAERLFTINLPDGAQGYRLLFNTDVTQPGRYSNTIGLTGTYNASDGAASVINVTAEDISAAGTGWNGSITITKTDPDGNPIASPAVFELLDSSRNVKQTLSTDASGRVVFQRLKLRTYYIREKTAPLGYRLDATEYMITLTGDTVETRNQALSVSNDPLTAAITLHKADENGDPLSGGLFRIFRVSDTAFATPLASVASIGGVIRFENLAPGDYVVREIEAPLGYRVWTSGVPVSLVVDAATNTLPDTEIVAPIADEQLTAAIILHKAGESGEPLSGGLFQIFRAADTAFATPLQSVAATAGVIRFENLTAGDYVVREVEAPLGYNIWTSDVPVSLVVDAATNTLPDTEIAEPFVDVRLRASVTLRKTDEHDRPLSGGLFQIFLASDTAFATPL